MGGIVWRILSRRAQWCRVFWGRMNGGNKCDDPSRRLITELLRVLAHNADKGNDNDKQESQQNAAHWPVDRRTRVDLPLHRIETLSSNAEVINSQSLFYCRSTSSHVAPEPILPVSL